MNRGTLTLGYDWWEQGKFSAHVNVGQGNASVFLPTDAGFTSSPVLRMERSPMIS